MTAPDREMTLDEVIGRLPETHSARREYAALRAAANAQQPVDDGLTAAYMLGRHDGKQQPGGRVDEVAGQDCTFATPDDIALQQGPDDIPELLIAGAKVARFPKGSWAEVCDAFDSITGSTFLAAAGEGGA